MGWIDGTVISLFMFFGGYCIGYLRWKLRRRVSIKRFNEHDWFVIIDGKQASYMMSFDHADNTAGLLDEALNGDFAKEVRNG